MGRPEQAGGSRRAGPMPAAHARVLTAAVAVALAGATGVALHAPAPGPPPASGGVEAPPQRSPTLPRPTTVPAAAVAAAVAGVVDVDATVGYPDARSAGTGIVLTPDGEIVTNNHVIEGATDITVTDIGNGRSYPATVLGYSIANDVAVLRAAGASALATIGLDRVPAQVGDPVVAVGNAGGAGGPPATAAGAITALGQSISASDELSGASEQLQGLIRTDAQVKAGDSGGPLVDAAGMAAGMDTAASTGFVLGASAQQGFAIPAAAAGRIATDIVEGRPEPGVHIGATAFLGVVVAAYGGTIDAAPSDVVVSVTPGGPAAGAGVLPGDTITSLAGVATTGPSALSAALLALEPGRVVSLAWEDNGGRPRQAAVTLGEGPPQ